MHAEDGKTLGTHKSKADAEKQLAAIEAHKHDERAITINEGKVEPLSSEPVIVARNDGHYVCVGEKVLAMMPDAESAQECLRLLRGGPSFDHSVLGLIGELQAERALMKADMEAYINLWRYGRV